MSPIGISSIMFVAVISGDVAGCYPRNRVGWMTNVDGV